MKTHNITRAIRSLIISLSALWSISSAAIEPYPVVIDCTDALSYQLPLNSEGEPTMNTSVCQWETGTGSVPYLQVVASVTTKQSEIIFPTNELNKQAYYNIYVVTTPAKDKELPCWFRVRHSEWDEETGSFTSSDTYFTNPNPITADSDVPNADLIIKQAHNEQFFVAGATTVDTILIQSAFQVATPAANLIVSSCGPSNSSTREIIYTRTLALHKIIMVPYATAEEAATHVGEIPQSFDLPQPINGLYYDFNDDGTCQIVAGPIKPQGEIAIPETIEHEGQNYKVNSICSFAFYNLGITSLTIPDNIKEVGAYAFMNCKKLKEIAINSPELVLSNYAFESTSDYVEELYINIPSVPKNSTGWSKLQKLVLGDAVKKVEAGAFLDSKELSLLEIGEQVDTIYNNTFLGCYELDSISFGSNLKFIDVYAFSSPYNLRAVSIKAQNPPNISTNILSDYNVNNTTLYVPEGRRIYYLAAKVWRDFKKIIAPDDAGENDENILYPTIALDRKWETRYTLEDGSHVSMEFSVDDLTVIDGKIYGIVPARNRNFSNSYSKLNASTDYAQADTLFYRQKDKKVFYLFPDIDEEVLLFDYGLSVGDEYVNPLGERFYVVETNIFDKYAEHLYYYNEEEKPLALRLVSEDGMKEDVWIEGIGSREWGLIPPYMAKSLTNLEASPVKATTYHAYRATHYAGWVDQLLDIDEEKYKLVHFTYTPASGSSTYIVTKFVGNELQIKGTITTMDENNPNVLELLITDDNLIAYNFSYLHSHTYMSLEKIDIDIRIPGFKAGEYKIMYGEDDVINLVCEGADEDYIPFVERGKQWHVLGYGASPNLLEEDYYFDEDEEEVNIDGKSYLNFYSGDGDNKISLGLFREEDRRVYRYDPNTEKEYLAYDFTLKVGDTFETNAFNRDVPDQGVVTQVGYVDVKDKRLRTITFSFVDSYVANEFTWVEGIGTLSLPWGYYDGYYYILTDQLPWSYRLAYVRRNEQPDNGYFPFSILEEWGDGNFVYGQELVQGEEMMTWEEFLEKGAPLYQEVKDGKLHIWGYLWFQPCPNKYYLYCKLSPKGDHKTYTVSLDYGEVGLSTDCNSNPYAVDLYFALPSPEFKDYDYIFIDEDGEHPIVNHDKYHPFVEEGKVWKVSKHYGSGYNTYELNYFYFDGETTVGSHTCKRMMVTKVTKDTKETAFHAAIYEEGKKVYWAWESGDRLLYDFAAEAGDTIEVYDPNNYYGDNLTPCMVLWKNGKVTRIAIAEPDYEKGNENWPFDKNTIDFQEGISWREGVGSTLLPLDNVWHHESSGYYAGLMDCTIGTDTLYHAEHYIDDVSPYWSDEDDPEVKRETLDFTHVIKTKPTSPLMMATPTLLRAEYNDIALFIHPEGMTGQYQISIRKDNEAQDHFASIYNLGNLQSIDVNLAGYPEGEYTITVENDQELFTAHFVLPLDGTGINEIENEEMRNGENENAIYDLSGRKISSQFKVHSSQLQKVIYIQSGRKVVKK